MLGKAGYAGMLLLCPVLVWAEPMAWSPLDVRLTWLPPEGPTNQVDGYRVHCGYASRDYMYTRDVGLVLETDVCGVPDDTTTYWAITAYRLGDQKSESPYSAELVLDLEPPSVAAPDVIR